MLNKLDHARKGMPWCMMTAEEQQFIKDAPINTSTFLHTSGVWKAAHAVGTCQAESYWTDWERPAAPAQPANLPAGCIAYPVTWSVSHGGVLTWANGGTTDVQNCHIGMQNLGGGFLCCWVIGDDYKSKSLVPCGSGHFAKWAVFRPMEVTK